MPLSLVTGPASDPVTLAEAKGHCRVDDTESDGLIAGYLLAARQWVEGFVGRKLVQQTWEYTLSRFPWCIELPIGPLQSITSITYVDAAGVTQTVSAADYQVDSRAHVARIMPAYGKTWPVARVQFNSVTITAVVGYSVARPMPEEIRQAILMLVAHFYENRETINVGNIVSEIPFSVKSLLGPLRVHY